MARDMFFVMCVKCSLICFVTSAPSQVITQEQAAAISVHYVQEFGFVDDLHLANSTRNNDSKISSGSYNVGGNDVERKEIPEPLVIAEKVDKSGKDVKNDEVNIPVATGVKKAGARSNVMALSDDVITDALFTNIDTLQDHLEVCEEGLRQQLRLHSHGKLLQEVAVEEADYTPNRGGVTNEGEDSDDSSNSEKDSDEDEEDEMDEDNEDDEDDSNDESDNDNHKDDQTEKKDKLSPDMKISSASKTAEEKIRERRSVTASSRVGQPTRKVDVLAQRVVNRLSDRLEYLRSSLVQCHLLYRQFGLL